MNKHAPNCEWHAEQYPWECNCGAIPQALEARRGETGTGSIAEGDDIAVREADAPSTGGTHAQ